ncbi:sensor histidine kinase [Streptomyces sp. NPDC014006]|uniref:sensor histidine kinase n=1 Tax=Streptomyces sp. NPDC014006 TaxID=3364870 RepID=UPI0036FE2C86
MVAKDTQLEQRWDQFHRWGPYGMLGIATLIAVATQDIMAGPGRRYAAAALVGVALLLHLYWDLRPHTPATGTGTGRRRRTPSRAGTVFYAVRWAIAFALTWLNPFFALYAVTGYFDADELIPGRRRHRIGLFATSVTLAGSQSGGMPPKNASQWGVFFGMLVVNNVLWMVVGHLTHQEEERSRARADTIVELERTNTALQQALDENAALHAQLLVQAREAGVADERRRLAAEIHDTLAQGLTGIIAQLQVVVNTPDPDLARDHTVRAMDLARHSLGEARRSVHNLAPAALDRDELPEALKKTVAAWGERTGVRADFTVTGTAEQLHAEVSATLLRIAEEALSNTARHANATRAGVTLSFMGDEVVLDIRDDGRGFDPLALPERSDTGGFGLGGMRARAERIAGSLTVESEPGYGTALSARVPLVRHDR